MSTLLNFPRLFLVTSFPLRGLSTAGWRFRQQKVAALSKNTGRQDFTFILTATLILLGLIIGSRF